MKLLVVQGIAHPVGRGFHKLIDIEALFAVERMGNRTWKIVQSPGEWKNECPSDVSFTITFGIVDDHQ